MDELLSYSKYDYLICFPYQALFGDFYIFGTSNRAFESTILVQMSAQSITEDDEYGMTLGEIFPKYLQIKSKRSSDISDEETSILAFIRNFYAFLKEEISAGHRISFEKAQIMFTLPMDYAQDEYEEILRTFFLEVGWITNEDDKNKLLLVPYIDAFVHYLQNPPAYERKMQFERERKYLLLSRIVPVEDGKMECYTATCFRMQCATELALVSKKLASSDFLLTPTIIDRQTIRLPKLGMLVLPAVKRVLSQLIGGTMIRDVDQDMELSRIAGEIDYVLAMNPSFESLSGKRMGEFFDTEDFHRWNHQNLGDRFMDCFALAVFKDTSIQHYTKQVCDFVQENLDSYGCIMDSPDGIRDIIPHDYSSLEGSYRCLIVEALFQANIVKRDEKFKEIPTQHELCTSGALKPLRMVQVANVILPPISLAMIL